MQIYTSAIFPASLTATSEASGYTADLLASPRILKQWRSTGVTQNVIEVQFSTAASVAGFWINHTNASGGVLVEAGNGSYATVGTASVIEEHGGRRKAKVDLSGSIDRIRFTIASGNPPEGYWFVGSVFTFMSKYTLDPCATEGSRHEYNSPQEGDELPNGRTVVVSTINGAGPLSTVEINFDQNLLDDATHNAARLLRKRLHGLTVGVDLQVGEGMFWPMKELEKTNTRTLNSGISPFSATFKEVA